MNGVEFKNKMFDLGFSFYFGKTDGPDKLIKWI